jgi:hypothetical protein
MRKARPILIKLAAEPSSLERQLLGLPPEADVLQQVRADYKLSLEVAEELFRRFDLRYGQWAELAFALAYQSGLVVRRLEGAGPGRRKGATKDGASRAHVWLAVHRIRNDNPGQTVGAACRHLCEARNSTWKGLARRTLLNRYDEAKKDRSIMKQIYEGWLLPLPDKF